MSDEELWKKLEAQDGYVVMGIKNPGEARGVWRDRVLARPEVMKEAETLLRASTEVLAINDHLPFLTLRIKSLEALTAIRALPFRDYLQPLNMDTGGESGLMDGCGWASPYSGGATLTSWGDPIPPGLDRMKIRDAWRRNAGEDAVIGITDTGVSADQDNLRQNFSTGASATGRWHSVVTVIPGGTNDLCGHGTRLAGLAFAP